MVAVYFETLRQPSPNVYSLYVWSMSSMFSYVFNKFKDKYIIYSSSKDLRTGLFFLKILIINNHSSGIISGLLSLSTVFSAGFLALFFFFGFTWYIGNAEQYINFPLRSKMDSCILTALEVDDSHTIKTLVWSSVCM